MFILFFKCMHFPIIVSDTKEERVNPHLLLLDQRFMCNVNNHKHKWKQNSVFNLSGASLRFTVQTRFVKLSVKCNQEGWCSQRYKDFFFLIKYRVTFFQFHNVPPHFKNWTFNWSGPMLSPNPPVSHSNLEPHTDSLSDRAPHSHMNSLNLSTPFISTHRLPFLPNKRLTLMTEVHPHSLMLLCVCVCARVRVCVCPCAANAVKGWSSTCVVVCE